MEPKGLLDDIKKENFKPVYLLYGTEAYLRQDYKRRLCQALVPPDDLMNFSRFQGNPDLEEILDLARTQPWFAARRLILLEDTGLFKTSCDELADFIPEIPDTVVMVFSEEAIDKRGRLYKAVDKKGAVVSFEPLTPDRLSRWAKDYLHHNERRIDERLALTLVNRLGTDMALLKNEMEKLIAYTAGKDSVTMEDIELVCSLRLEDRIFDMLKAIAAHDRKGALELYDDLLALKEAPIKILVLLGRQYSQLRRAKELEGRGLSTRELASAIGVNPYAIRTLTRLCEHFSVSALRADLEKIIRTDEDIKLGLITDRLGVELLILELSVS